MDTLNLLDCVEQDVIEQAETILTEQGIPMQYALSMFFNQIISKRGIPFEIEVPLDMGSLTNEQLAYEIEKADNGITHSWEDVKAELNRKYGIGDISTNSSPR